MQDLSRVQPCKRCDKMVEKTSKWGLCLRHYQSMKHKERYAKAKALKEVK